MTTYPDKNKQRPYVKQHAKQKRQALKRFWLGVCVAFIGGYSLAYVYQPPVLTTWVRAFVGGDAPLLPSVDSKTAHLKQPKLEFYTLLTQEKAMQDKPKLMKVTPPLVPVVPAQTPTRTPAHAAVEVAESKRVYVLQLASFQRREDAEHLQASLVMRGFDVSIKTVKQHGVAWHRVMMGPFTSRDEAERAKVTVAQNERISGIVRRMDV